MKEKERERKDERENLNLNRYSLADRISLLSLQSSQLRSFALFCLPASLLSLRPYSLCYWTYIILFIQSFFHWTTEPEPARLHSSLSLSVEFAPFPLQLGKVHCLNLSLSFLAWTWTWFHSVNSFTFLNSYSFSYFFLIFSFLELSVNEETPFPFSHCFDYLIGLKALH